MENQPSDVQMRHIQALLASGMTPEGIAQHAREAAIHAALPPQEENMELDISAPRPLANAVPAPQPLINAVPAPQPLPNATATPQLLINAVTDNDIMNFVHNLLKYGDPTDKTVEHSGLKEHQRDGLCFLLRRIMGNEERPNGSGG
uniref:Uncharacterized protein n=1 Tax=Panagrolaimus davidi TaxID=227884 RepID=A0A914PCM0_9BILA